MPEHHKHNYPPSQKPTVYMLNMLFKICLNNQGWFDVLWKGLLWFWCSLILNFPLLPLSSFQLSSSFPPLSSSLSSTLSLSWPPFFFHFPFVPSTSDLTKKLCTAPYNEVYFFHMLMLLLTAQCTAQGKKQSWSEKTRPYTHTQAYTTHRHTVGMVKVTVNPD